MILISIKLLSYLAIRRKDKKVILSDGFFVTKVLNDSDERSSHGAKDAVVYMPRE